MVTLISLILSLESSDTRTFGRSWFDSIDLVGFVLSLLVVARLRLPNVGTGEAQQSHHGTDTDILLEPQRAVPGFNLPRRGKVFRLAPKTPLFRGMPTGLRHFWSYRACLGHGSACSTHIKKGLVQCSCVRRAHDKYYLTMWYCVCVCVCVMK